MPGLQNVQQLAMQVPGEEGRVIQVPAGIWPGVQRRGGQLARVWAEEAP